MNENVTKYLEKQLQMASPAEQIVMLYDGAIRFYSKARYAIEQNDIQERFNNAQRAGDIVAYLMDILDLEKGGEIALRLHKIYSHILVRHMDIDMNNDPGAIDEIVGHLKILRKSWESIAKGDDQVKKDDDPTTARGPKSAIA